MDDHPKEAAAITAALPNPLPRKLNLGCGWDRRPGWLNVDLFDFHSPDLVADVCDLPMLPPSAFDEILAQDVLEHLPRGRVPVALREWARLAAPDGLLRVRVPSLPHTAALLWTAERREVEAAEEVLQMVYGTQAYGGDFHLSGYTFATLAARLATAGFLLCEASLRDGWLIEAAARRCTELTVPEEIVHNRYVAVLGRPVDPSGLSAFAARLKDATLDADGLDAILRASPEAQGGEPPQYAGEHGGRRGLLRAMMARVRRWRLGRWRCGPERPGPDS